MASVLISATALEVLAAAARSALSHRRHAMAWDHSLSDQERDRRTLENAALEKAIQYGEAALGKPAREVFEQPLACPDGPGPQPGEPPTRRHPYRQGFRAAAITSQREAGHSAPKAHTHWGERRSTRR